MCGQIHSFYLGKIEDHPMGGTSTINMEAHQQKQYYDRKTGTVNLKHGNLVLVKADAFKGKRKINDRWEEDTWEVVHQIMRDILQNDKPAQKVMHPPLKLISSCHVRGWHSLVYRHLSCMGHSISCCALFS